jgi:hypothetical protein
MIKVHSFIMTDRLFLNRHEILWRALDAAKRQGEMLGFRTKACFIREISQPFQSTERSYTFDVYGYDYE